MGRSGVEQLAAVWALTFLHTFQYCGTVGLFSFSSVGRSGVEQLAAVWAPTFYTRLSKMEQ